MEGSAFGSEDRIGWARVKEMAEMGLNPSPGFLVLCLDCHADFGMAFIGLQSEDDYEKLVSVLAHNMMRNVVIKRLIFDALEEAVELPGMVNEGESDYGN